MSKVENQFGKQQPKPAEPGTENHGTHDAKPKTLNPEPETGLPAGPNSLYWFSVLCFGF